MKIQLLINPEGSNFSYEQLRDVFQQNIFMIEMLTDHEFNPIAEGPGWLSPQDDTKLIVIKFLPKSEFGSPFHLAGIRPSGTPGVTWIGFNINMIGMLTLPFIRALGLHEQGHEPLGMGHIKDSKYTIMSTHEHRKMIDKSLFWRHDFIKLGCNVGHIFADEHMRIMIPSITHPGTQTQWGVVLQYLSENVFGIKHAYEADDGVEMEEKATFFDDDGDGILELHNVTTVDGVVHPLARFKMKTANTLELLP